MALTWKKLVYDEDVVLKTLFDANTILAANSDNTPAAVTIAEQQVVGRATGGNITGLAIDSDLSSVSANDDTIPSAKATKAALDAKLASSRLVQIRKAGNQTVQNSETLVDDSTLLFAVAANEIWEFEFWINYGDGSSGGIRAKIDYPSGATCYNLMFGNTSSATAYQVYYGTGGGTGTGFGVYNTSSGAVFLQIKGYVVVGSTAGNLKLQWAQSTATANGTTVTAASFVKARRIA